MISNVSLLSWRQVQVLKLCLTFKHTLFIWMKEKQWALSAVSWDLETRWWNRIPCQNRCQTDAVVYYWLTSQLMSWLLICERTPGHLLGVRIHGEVRVWGRLPGQTLPCHFQWAHSTFPPPSCHSSPHHDRQIHLSRKEELILYIWDSDRLAAPRDQWN